jgi:hypothetical protein
MLRRESEWIKAVLLDFKSNSQQNIILNIGSSTQEFIDNHQPYQNTNVIEPLKLLGKVINVDIKEAAGVDLVANFMEKRGRDTLRECNSNIILLSNLLEHVENPYTGLSLITNLQKTGDYLILTGPKRYPYHPDPIDNMFRPTKREIRKLLQVDYKVLKIQTVRSGSVLTSTSTSKKDSYKWLNSRAKNIVRDKATFFRTLRLALTPASAFCCLCIRK